MVYPSLKTFHSVIIAHAAWERVPNFYLFCYAMTDKVKLFIFDACCHLQVNAVNMHNNNNTISLNLAASAVIQAADLEKMSKINRIFLNIARFLQDWVIASSWYLSIQLIKVCSRKIQLIDGYVLCVHFFSMLNISISLYLITYCSWR